MKRRRDGAIALILFVGGPLVVFPTIAKRGIIQPAITVTTSHSTNREAKEFPISSPTYSQGKFGGSAIDSTETILDGLITDFKLKVIAGLDLDVNIKFSVRATAAITTFDIVSDVITFDPITDGDVYSSASIAMTDRTNELYTCHR